MTPSNKEMQLLKTCQLYEYVLKSQSKEVPEEVGECTVSYDHLVDCTALLAEEMQGLDSDVYKKLIDPTESRYAHDLAYWWQMYQEADALRRELFSDV